MTLTERIDLSYLQQSPEGFEFLAVWCGLAFKSQPHAVHLIISTEQSHSGLFALRCILTQTLLNAAWSSCTSARLHPPSPSPSNKRPKISSANTQPAPPSTKPPNNSSPESFVSSMNWKHFYCTAFCWIKKKLWLWNKEQTSCVSLSPHTKEPVGGSDWVLLRCRTWSRIEFFSLGEIQVTFVAMEGFLFKSFLMINISHSAWMGHRKRVLQKKGGELKTGSLLD